MCCALQILQQAWPFIGQYLEKLLVEIIAPAIRTSSIHLQTLSFTKVNIGDKVSERPVTHTHPHSNFSLLQFTLSAHAVSSSLCQSCLLCLIAAAVFTGAEGGWRKGSYGKW